MNETVWCAILGLGIGFILSWIVGHHCFPRHHEPIGLVFLYTGISMVVASSILAGFGFVNWA